MESNCECMWCSLDFCEYLLARVGLGISTLLLYVPTALAAMHQSGSLLTLSFAIWLTHELKHIKKLPK
ncbi:Cytochrome c oxidase assembly protein COX15 [Portunus trituberculatus]|uniref:Cytochrome c oxidase assembly protein COX15 n=1 Tax=Portunus trituberculatus TaxID=210409 RepID=A0A5B7JJ53_PORTR|nr:Cytochrome c oxidase assembly protein COX15 [Portunus trituberculatus]